MNLSNATPPAVTTTIQQLCSWLAKYTLSGSYKPHNVFFSGTFKNIVEVSPMHTNFTMIINEVLRTANSYQGITTIAKYVYINYIS